MIIIIIEVEIVANQIGPLFQKYCKNSFFITN